MKVMDKHKNIINLLGVCTEDGEFKTQVHNQKSKATISLLLLTHSTLALLSDLVINGGPMPPGVHREDGVDH